MSGLLPKFVKGGLLYGTFTQETPGGTVNGTNTAFTLASTPTANGTVVLTQNGLVLVQGTDYTISGTSITMAAAPLSSQTLYAYYVKAS